MANTSAVKGLKVWFPQGDVKEFWVGQDNIESILAATTLVDIVYGDGNIEEYVGLPFVTYTWKVEKKKR